MKVSILIPAALVLIGLANWNGNSSAIEQSVNSVIGDISFSHELGVQPNTKTDEVIRLKTHLKYVENLLRKKDVSGLSTNEQLNRLHALELLNEYWKAGAFPKNFDYPDQRIPCFIDKEGAICAVGYLIEKTAGRHVSEEINSKFKYDYLLAMNDKTVDNWIMTSGLTKEECAMIQPTYGPAPTDNYISPTYGIASSALGGINLSLNSINAIQVYKGTNSKTIPIIGLVTGAGQVALGVLNYPQEEETFFGVTVNEAQRNLSLLNITLGTSTIILSSWNLIANRKPKDKSYSWNIYGVPTSENSVGLAFGMTKRF